MRSQWSAVPCFLAIGALSIVSSASESGTAKEKAYPNPKRFEKAIQAFEADDKKDRPPPGAIVCIGSSSMRGWHKTIKDDLAPLTVVPRGFGGSTMNDALHYAKRIVIPYEPRAIVIYEGDNDIAAGITPEKVRDTFRAFAKEVHRSLPGARLYFLSIKPSIRRRRLWPEMKKANGLVAKECSQNKWMTFVDVASPMLDAAGHVKKDIFKADDLHMNEEGYAIWRKVVRAVLMPTELAFEKREQEGLPQSPR